MQDAICFNKYTNCQLILLVNSISSVVKLMLICKNFTHQLFLSLSRDFKKLRPLKDKKKIEKAQIAKFNASLT